MMNQRKQIYYNRYSLRVVTVFVLLFAFAACKNKNESPVFVRENEWYRSDEIGLYLVGKNFAWSIAGVVKTEGLHEIELHIVRGESEIPFYAVEGRIPKGPIRQYGNPMPLEDIPWLEMPGTSRFPVRVILRKDSGEMKSFLVKVGFSEAAKQTLLKIYRQRNAEK